MAPLLPSSPSFSTAYSPVLQSSTHSSMGKPVPPAHILPRAKFHPIFRALSRTARAQVLPLLSSFCLPLGRGRARLSARAASNLNLEPL